MKAFYDAGCRYLQFDDTVWAYLCSQEELQKARDRGDNPDGLQEIYARLINYALAERPADMVITTHVCRGNFRSTWISSGGYEPVAETMLAGWLLSQAKIASPDGEMTVVPASPKDKITLNADGSLSGRARSGTGCHVDLSMTRFVLEALGPKSFKNVSEAIPVFRLIPPGVYEKIV